ncbi:pentatricopeptide repeat-containing protein At1g76280 isoform X2 [Typha latifolia]|uniref:pentatricopeptide repeat-containing protein At1g76280 isoform X2 n=1 Tax=Typha latifolia TaxID=4733 RepID=UPI003C2E8F3F
MHRYLLRATRGLLGSTNVPRAGQRKNAADKVQSRHASEGFQGDDYITWKGQLPTRFVQLQIVNALRKGDREGASKMLLNYVTVNHSLGPEDFTHILEYCAQAPDPSFVMETWKVLEEEAVDLNKRSYRSIVRAFSKGEYLNEALNLLSLLVEGDRGHVVLPLFNIFLSGCDSKKSSNEAEQCLKLMERRLIGKSEITYWELLKLAVLQRSLTAVHKIWKDCTRYYNPNIITLRKFVWSMVQFGDVESAYIVLQHMVTLAKQRSASLTMSSARRYQSSRLDIPIPAKIGLSDNLFSVKSDISLLSPLEQGFLKAEESSRDLDLFGGEKKQDEENSEFCVTKQEMRNASVPVRNFLRWSFNDMLHACARFNKYKLAEQLFLQMHDLGLEPSQHTYDGFVKAVIKEKGIAYGMKVVDLMIKRNIEPSNDTLATLSIAHSKTLNLMLAEILLGRISDNLPKYIHAFNALLAACCVMDEPERAVRVIAIMKHLNIKSNIRTYELMFSLFGNVNDPYEKGDMFSHVDVAKRISIIHMDMMKNEIQHSFTSMKNLIRALGAEGMIQEMLQYLNVAESMLWMMDPYKRSDMYNTVLHALVKSKESHAAIRVFKNMRLYGLPANIAIYNIMIECCGILRCFRSASALVSLMYRDGFCPQLLTYTALIKVLLADENFDSALHYLEQLRIEGIRPDIQIFNTVLKEAYAKGQIDVIEHIIERMHKDKIQPDPSTLWYTFSAYVECGFENTAVEALQVLSLRMISEDDNILQKKRVSFEDLIHNEDPDAELKIIETFKASQEYLATALLNLRWCAIAGFSISCSPAKSLWAKRLSSSYGVGKS